MASSSKQSGSGIEALLLAIAVAPLVLVVGVCVVLPITTWHYLDRLGRSLRMTSLVRAFWVPRGIRGLVVSSDHRLWNGWVGDILGAYNRSLVHLNWSKREEWQDDRGSLDVEVFEHWIREKGYANQNRRPGRRQIGKTFYPVIVLFTPWWWPRVIDLRDACIALSHGDHKPLVEAKLRLQHLLG